MRSTSLILLALVAGPAPVVAQTMVRAQAPLGQRAMLQQRATARIPLRTTQLKAAGVDDTTISRLFDIFRAHDLTPVQVDRILVTERDYARMHGPTDNFGAFVQTQLDSGKRGQALATAIHAEHRAHGHKHDAEHARKAKLKADREAARARAHERERARREERDRPQVNPGTTRRP